MCTQSSIRPIDCSPQVPLAEQLAVAPAMRSPSESQLLKTIAADVHAADVYFGRAAGHYDDMGGPAKAVVLGRAALAVNLRDLDQLDEARENAARRLRIQYPELAVSMEAARVLTDAVLGVWLPFMSGERRR